MKKIFIITTLLIFACSSKYDIDEIDLDSIAEDYVKLVLYVGLYDPSYIDAYFGPEEWKPSKLEESEIKNFQYQKLTSDTDNILMKLNRVDTSGYNQLLKLRYEFLQKQLLSVRGKIELLSGKQMGFVEESRILYDAIIPEFNKSEFEESMKKLDKLLPGNGEVSERYLKFREKYIVPPEKISTVFEAAFRECRKRTKTYVNLPKNENVKIEYVTDKSWTAYNWYKGNSFSVMQLNITTPFYIDMAITLSCHECYPGHHTYYTLLEKNLANKRGWMEFKVYPLYSPIMLVSEGAAEFGIELTFPVQERINFEKEVLFPLAGFNPSDVENYYKIQNLAYRHNPAEIEGARQYLDNLISREEAVEWFINNLLMKDQRAERYIKFIDKYRSYNVTYFLGRELIKNYIIKHGSKEISPLSRWKIFTEILITPRTPSGLH